MKEDPPPPPTVDFDGKWYNQHQSVMDLVVDKAGHVKGWYVTGVGAPGREERFPLVGFATGDQITFCVNFGKYGSLTAWVGQHTETTEDDAQIVTFWHLTTNVKDPDEPKNLWATVLTGSDVFQRNAAPKVYSLLKTQPSHPVIG